MQWTDHGMADRDLSRYRIMASYVLTCMYHLNWFCHCMGVWGGGGGLENSQVISGWIYKVHISGLCLREKL